MGTWAVAGAEDRVATRWFGYLFMAAVFFPYVRVLPIGSDVQPAALLLAIGVALASRTGRFPRTIAPLFAVMLAAVLIACVTGINGLAVRGLANYFSLFIIAFATYSALVTGHGLSRRFVATVVWLWFSVGLVQTLLARSFLTQLLSNVRTTDIRGVVGLAPEPTAYGIHCLILLILVTDMFGGRQRRRLSAALIVQIVLFARSSMAIMFLLIWGLLYIATHYSARRVLIGGASVLGVALIATPVVAHWAGEVKGVRAIALLHLVVTSPALILVRDQSVSDRVAAIVFSLIGAVQNFLIPHGFTSWSAFVKEIGPSLIRYIPYYTAGDRIMSGYGAALYELGAFGLLIPIVVTRSISFRYWYDRRRFLTVAVVLNLLLLTAIPLAYPPIAFLIGYFCYAGIRDQVPVPEHMTALRSIPRVPA